MRTRKPFQSRKIDRIDYKDVELLSKALSPQGKLLSRKRTGADAKTQHKLRRAIHRARFMGLISNGG